MFEIYLSLILKGIKKLDDLLEKDKAPFKEFCQAKINDGLLTKELFDLIFNP